MRNDDPVVFMLIAAFAIVFVIFLSEINRVPVRAPAKAKQDTHCAILTSSWSLPGGLEPLTYEEVKANDKRRCDLKKFPYCHALPIPFNKQIGDDFWDNWREFGCERDLVPDRPLICGPIKHPYYCEPTPLAPVH